MKILLSGYYGFDNAGDEAVLYAIISALRENVPNGEITVLSNQPEKTTAEYGVRAVNRWGKLSLVKEIKACDVFISGGGSLLQDVTSKNGILYYLGLIYLAEKLGKKVLIYAQGIGPIQTPRNWRLTKKILNKTHGITVRDFASRQLLMQMGVYREINVCADPVWGINPQSIKREHGEEILRQYIDEEKLGEKVMMLAVRNWQDSAATFAEIAESCDNFAAEGWQIVFVPFHYPEDVEAGKAAASLMKQQAVVLDGNYSPEETMEILANGDLVIAMRLHGLIMGSVLRKPIVAISYDPKVDSFMQLLRNPYCLPVAQLQHEKLEQMVQKAWQNKEREMKQLTQFAEIFAAQAKEPAKMVQQLVGAGK